MSSTLRDRLARALLENGLDSTGTSSIHGWRCEHPDRYGPCGCFAGLLDDLVAAAEDTTDP